MSKKAREAGYEPGAVPVIDARGTVIQGFIEDAWLEALR
jgi:hypothetical protein